MFVIVSPVLADEQNMQIQYGKVFAQRAVQVEDHSAAAGLVGGLIGVVAFQGFSGSAAGDAITGGAVGAGGSVALEKWGQDRIGGTQYDVELISGESLQLITDQTAIDIGDCVAVEASEEHANLRRVSDVHCDSENGGWQDPHVQTNAAKAAADCQEAKRALLSAATDEEIQAAARRARALCDT
jgi:hypothetical protein